MLKFYFVINPLVTLHKTDANGYFFSGKFALRKNLSNIDVDTKDCNVELIKQVLPMLYNPLKIDYFFN